ncbi:hypothetical protein [Aquibium oceanicum]|nr:hypothetical protein [Aquibium oceanicum]
MLRRWLAAGLWAGTLLVPVHAEEPSVEAGLRVSRIGGCHDCHTQGFAETGGQIDPSMALKGSPVGFMGPWGTTYPTNLLLTVEPMSEDAFLDFAKTLETRPPMPWFNLHYMTEFELRSLFRYIKSLGEPGEPAPEYLAPGETPKTPWIVFAPPQMPE